MKNDKSKKLKEKKPLTVSDRERERERGSMRRKPMWWAAQLLWKKKKKKQSIVWGTNGFCSPPRDLLLLPTSPSLFFRSPLLVKL